MARPPPQREGTPASRPPDAASGSEPPEAGAGTSEGRQRSDRRGRLGGARAVLSALAWVGAGLLATLAIGALVLSAGAVTGRKHLADRATALGEQLGCRVHLGEIQLPLAAGARLERVRLDGPACPVALEARGLRTDRTLRDLLAGRRRPERIVVEELRTDVHLPRLRSFVRRLGEGLGGGDAGEAGPGRSRPLEVRVLRLRGEVRSADAEPPRPFDRGRARLERDASGRWRIRGRVRLHVDGNTRRVRLTAGTSPEGLRVRFRSGAPVGIALDRAGRRVRVSLDALSRRAGEPVLRAEHLRLATPDREVRCHRARIRFRSSLRASPKALEGVRCEEARVTTPRGSVRATRAELERATSPDEPRTAPPEVAWMLTVDGPRARLAGDRVRARAGSVRIGLRGDPPRRLASDRPLAALGSLAVREPSVRIELPHAATLQELQGLDLDDGGSEAEPDAPTEGERDEPPEGAPPGEANEGREGSDAPPLVSRQLPGIPHLRAPGGAELVNRLRRIDLDLDRGRISIREPGGERVLDLDRVAIRTLADGAGGLRTRLEARLRQSGRRSGGLRLLARLDEEGVVRAARGRIHGTGVAHSLSRLSPYVTVTPEARVRLDFDYAAPGMPLARAAPRGEASGAEEREEASGSARAPQAASDEADADADLLDQHRIRGTWSFSDFGFEAWRISHAPVTGLEGRMRYRLRYDPERRRVALELPRIDVDRAFFAASAAVEDPPGDPPAELTAELRLPQQDCGRVADAIPEALIPRLRGLRAYGALGFHFGLRLDLAEPDDVDLDVGGDVDDCRVPHLGPDIDLEELDGPDFVHHPVEPDEGLREDIAVGPGTESWVPAEQLTPLLKTGAIVTEDRHFREHPGVRWRMVGGALAMNLEHRRFVYGGSTITQQLVKNLFLTREKTLSRKLEELIITWQLEETFDKARILTLYLNVIEYGPDIYGIRSASRHYFARSPQGLDAVQVAFLMGLKPYPDEGYEQWKQQSLDPWWVERVRDVLRSMHDPGGVVTEAELEAADPQAIDFRAPDEPERPRERPPRRGLPVHRPGSPLSPTPSPRAPEPRGP